MLDIALIALFQAVAGDPAPAVEASAAEAVAPDAEAAIDPDDVVRCRREPVVGTRLSQRICTTLRQDREMREYAQREVRRGQSQMWIPEGPIIPQPGPMGH